MGARGVRVNAVAPTYIETPLNAFVKNSPRMCDAWIGGTPMARMGQVDEIASRRAVPRLGGGEPDDRKHRFGRWRLHLLVVLAEQHARAKIERRCGRPISGWTSGAPAPGGRVRRGGEAAGLGPASDPGLA